jgi:hypothetical protein
MAQPPTTGTHRHDDLAELHRRMSPKERLELAFELSRAGSRLARAGKRARRGGGA